MRFLLAFLLLSSHVFGELSVTSRPVKAITGLSTPEIVANVILVGDDSVPVVSSVAVVSVVSKAKFVRVKARTDLFNSTALKPIGERTNDLGIITRDYLLSGAGRYAIEAMIFDAEAGIEEASIEVIVGPSKPPEPIPPPTPPPSPVGPDVFDNIGQRVSVWSSSLPRRAEVGAIYRAASVSLRSDPGTTIDSVSARLVSERAKLLGADSEKYVDIVGRLNADLKSRWSSISNRGTYSDYLASIAAGFGVAP